MSLNSAIEWTEATWNPVTGCTRVSKGCDLCYAVTLTRRLAAMGQEKYTGLINPGKRHFNGVIKEHPEVLSIPLERRQPTTYFVNSMSDLFHPGVREDFIADVFRVMAQCPQHKFQVLTKRPERMAEVMPLVYNKLGLDPSSPLVNVWMGTSVEDEEAARQRIDALRNVPAAVRFLSCEPLLGRLADLDLNGIHWVIVGGESGPGARAMEPEWVLEIRDQCQRAGVAFFFKQWGGINKKRTGRKLEGRTWDNMPVQPRASEVVA